jgi:hypothetical protein
VHHEECWHENKGCSTYGCPQVNALNPPMKIDILADPDNQPYYGNPNYGNQPNYGNNFVLPPVHPALQKIKFAFHGWWISWVVCWFGAIIIGAITPEDTQVQQGFGQFVLIVLIPCMIFGCMLFYRLWSVTDISVRNNTTPSFATFGFYIPFYGIYWFVAGFYQLVDNINKTLSLRGNNYQVNVRSLGAWAGGLYIIFSCIANVAGDSEQLICAVVMFIVVPIMLLFYYLSCIKGAEQILNSPPLSIEDVKQQPYNPEPFLIPTDLPVSAIISIIFIFLPWLGPITLCVGLWAISDIRKRPSHRGILYAFASTFAGGFFTLIYAIIIIGIQL